MGIEQSTLSNKVQRIRADIARETGIADPFNPGVLNGLSLALAGLSDELSIEINQLLIQLFPTSATGSFLELWGEVVKLSRKSAVGASGSIVVTGTLTTVLPAATEFQAVNGQLYSTVAEEAMIINISPVSSINRSGNTATVITTSDNNFATGVLVTISGAVQPEYNGIFSVTVLSAQTFTYTVSGSPVTPATGTITSSFTGQIVNVTAQEVGSSGNAVNGEQLTLQVAIAGIDNTAFVDLNGIAGGADVQNDDDYRSDILNKFADPVSSFSEDAIINAAREVPEITRVLVKRATPSAGKVEILIMSDIGENIFPTSQQLFDVKQKVIAIADVCIEDLNTDISVIAPISVSTAFNFSSILPNTDSMKNAIVDNLQAFFSDGVAIEESVSEAKYQAAIINTVDPVTGETLENFALTTPTGDIAISVGEVATLGAVTFV